MPNPNGQPKVYVNGKEVTPAKKVNVNFKTGQNITQVVTQALKNRETKK